MKAKVGDFAIWRSNQALIGFFGSEITSILKNGQVYVKLHGPALPVTPHYVVDKKKGEKFLNQLTKLVSSLEE